MAKPTTLETLAVYGGAALISPTEAELGDFESPVRNAGIALERYRAAATRFAETKAAIMGNARFSAEGRAAELSEYSLRELNELARHDGILERAQTALADLQAEARKVAIDLSPAQVALLPTGYARLAECDPLEVPNLLADAAEARDVVTLAAFLSGPRTKELRLAVTDEQLDMARDAAAGPLPADKRRTLARLRELTDAAAATRKALVGELRRAGKLDLDPLILATMGAEQDKPANDPIADMAAGKPAKAA